MRGIPQSGGSDGSRAFPGTRRGAPAGHLHDGDGVLGRPVIRWLYPEPADYLRHFPEFVEVFGGAAFREESVWRVGDFTAVSMWMAPGVELDGDDVMADAR